MNRRGFTLVELLAVLVILGIILSIVGVMFFKNFKESKEKTEGVFISTLEDAMDVYLNSDAKNLSFSSSTSCTLSKTHGSVSVYKASSNVTFNSIINSTYKPLSLNDLVNPANEDYPCNANASISIYRDSDYVYYYKVNNASLGCLKATGVITNLPNGSGC